VPGWGHLADGTIHFRCPTGLLIPVRDPQGRIIALKIRPDRRPKKGKYRWVSGSKYGGPSPGSPAHIPLGITAPAELIRITEGELKADLATIRTGIPTISAPGATNWKPALEAAMLLGAKTIRIAYDMDAQQKTAVADALAALAVAVKDAGLGLEFECWDPHYKGIDDALQAGVAIELLQGADAEQAMAAVVEKSLEEKPAVEAVDDPHRLARAYLKEHHEHPDGPTLRRYRDQWHEWDGASYRIVEDKEVNSKLDRAIKAEFDRANRLEVRRWLLAGKKNEEGKKIKEPDARKVTTRLVGDVAAALAGMVLVPGDLVQPAWLIDDDSMIPADEVLPCKNTLVHLPSAVEGSDGATRRLTPLFFCPYALDYAFNPDPPEPVEWFHFLHMLWPKDDAAIETLQEWFGYCLGPDTSLQKCLFLIGPKRSGKGTIARVLKSLVGEPNTSGITLADLDHRFGMAPLIGKMLQIFADERLSGRTDLAAVVGHLLRIIGEDHLTIDRKNISAWHGRLTAKLVLLANELPHLPDASGAMIGRIVLLRLVESFAGREDTGLFAKLERELPGILLWAIAGRERLLRRGHFLQPLSGRKSLQELEQISNPFATFVGDWCELGAKFQVEVDDLFQKWNFWRGFHGYKPTDSGVFGNLLGAAFPKIEKIRPHKLVKENDKDGNPITRKKRVWMYSGIKLKEELCD
jgi:P4 family phage/plasmid primase-like protien